MPSPIRTIFIVENKWGGHHPTYIKHLIEAFAALGCHIVLSLPSLATTAFIQDLHPSILVHQEPTQPAKVFNLAYWRWLAAIVHILQAKSGSKPDLVFIPYLDQALFPALNGFPLLKKLVFNSIVRFPWSGLFFHPKFNLYPLSESIFQLESCHSIALLDSRETQRINQNFASSKAIQLPDFADLTTSPDRPAFVTHILALAAVRPIIALAGVLARRKGIITLADIAQLANPQDYFFVACGKIQDSDFSTAERNRLRALHSHPTSNLLITDQFLPSEADFNALIQASSYVFLGYQDFPHSSNVMTKAAHFLKPILCMDSSYMGYLTKKHNLGLTFLELDPAAGLQMLIKLHTGYEPDTKSMSAFAAEMTLTVLQARLSQLLQL